MWPTRGNLARVEPARTLLRRWPLASTGSPVVSRSQRTELSNRGSSGRRESAAHRLFIRGGNKQIGTVLSELLGKYLASSGSVRRKQDSLAVASPRAGNVAALAEGQSPGRVQASACITEVANVHIVPILKLVDNKTVAILADGNI